MLPHAMGLGAGQGTGLTLHGQPPEHDLPHPWHTLNQLDGPLPLLFALDAAGQVVPGKIGWLTHVEHLRAGVQMPYNLVEPERSEHTL